ncbi:MAG: cation diffusion facilitator family transporter [Rikenellaceae bacterium]
MAHNHHHHHHNTSGKTIATAFLLNLFFAIFELFGGLYTNSIAITSDALHDFGDSISLGLAWYFEKLAKRKRTKSYSYGYKRFSVLGAIINSLILLCGSIVVLYEAIPRLFNPVHSDVKGMFIFAIVGIAVNGFAALRLKRGETLNERTVSLHLLEDVLGWVAILIGSIVMYFVDAPIIDPIMSVIITIFILYNVFRNLLSIKSDSASRAGGCRY